MIGTLNEGLLHAQLKAWYRRPGDLVEHPVDGYVVDLVRGGTLVEIQTGGLAPLGRKLDCLLARHAVRLVVPVALTRGSSASRATATSCRAGARRGAAARRTSSHGSSACPRCLLIPASSWSCC